MLPCFQKKGLGSQLLYQVYKHYLPDPHCFEITVEAPSEGFQLMKDALDLKLLFRNPAMSALAAHHSQPLTDPRQIFDMSRILNKEHLTQIASSSKLTKAQVSRVFDIALLSAVDQNDTKAVGAYEAFLRKKLERLNSQNLFTKVKEKYIEYEGKVEPVNYTQFVTKNPESRFLL